MGSRALSILFVAMLLPASCALDAAAPSGAGGRAGSGAGSNVAEGGSGGGVGTGQGASAPGVGGGGEGGRGQNLCGNGAIDADEACDDGNDVTNDGCSHCKFDPGFTCSRSEPTTCALVVEKTGIAVKIPDNAYDGTLGSMACATLEVPLTGLSAIGPNTVWLDVGIDHPFVGDLVIKLQSPSGTVTTLLSRPGFEEPDDTGAPDDAGDDSDLVASAPITFHALSPADAEQMGELLSTGTVICEDDPVCTFAPNGGAGPGNGLEDFLGESPDGTWTVCVGDAVDKDDGGLHLARLWVPMQ
jgi:cysteine-rich repeat protein